MAKQGTQPVAGMPQRAGDPATDAAAITPNDSTDLTNYSRAVYVGGTGDVVVYMASDGGAGTAITFKAVPVGTILPICVRRVLTSSTATNLVALY